MRKVILGVSLFWPMLLGLAGGIALEFAVGHPNGFKALLGVILGGGLMQLWIPHFRKTRFGVVVSSERLFGMN